MRSSRGRIVTFYSYKGGTGRTMALANVAVLLAQENRGDILMIDWDLEAPGLHRFFEDLVEPEEAGRPFEKLPGLIDLFRLADEYVDGAASRGARPQPDLGGPRSQPNEIWQELPFDAHVIKCKIPSLYFVKAGSFDAEYPERINTFDWEGLYRKAPGIFRGLADYLASRFRYVFIDARTGVTDSSGICTTLLPDRLAVVFTPNRQSMDGVVELVERATKYRQRSNDLRPLLVFPIPSRVELSEDALRKRWRFGDPEEKLAGYQRTFEDLFARIYDLTDCELERYFNEIQVQHSTRFSYGEKIAVREDQGGDRLSLAQSFGRLARCIEGDAAPWTFEAESAPPLREPQHAADAALRRLENEASKHSERASSLRLIERMLRAYELLAFGGAFVAATTLAVVYSPVYGGAVGLAGVGLAGTLEVAQRMGNYGERAGIHERTARLLQREKSFFETGAGPYSTAETPVARLAERVETTLADADELLAVEGHGRSLAESPAASDD